MGITYNLISGNLPDGIDLSTINNIGNIYGILTVADAPVWTTSNEEYMGIFNEGDFVNLDILATPSINTNSPIVSYRLMESSIGKYSNLPWGLSIQNASITGTIAELNDPTLSSFLPEDEPTWITPSGEILELNEEETTTYTLAASPSPSGSNIVYYTTNGGLPWGLTLTPETGEISGTSARLVIGASSLPDIEPKPEWNTTRGLLGRFYELEDINITLSATPKNGTTIKYKILDDNYSLPWGTILNSDTGVISGNAAECKLATDPVFYIPNGPNVSNDSNLGTFSIGDTVSIKINIETTNNRSLKFSWIQTGSTTNTYLPWGLTFDKETSTISGIIASMASIGDYTFNIYMIDSAYAVSIKNFTMKIEDAA